MPSNGNTAGGVVRGRPQWDRVNHQRGGKDTGQVDIRKVGDGKKGVLVEDFAVKEPLQEVPRHWSFAGWEAIGERAVGRREKGGGGREQPRNARPRAGCVAGGI